MSTFKNLSFSKFEIPNMKFTEMSTLKNLQLFFIYIIALNLCHLFWW